MNLGLGTVQFGLSYGVSNQTGQVPPDEVSRVLALAAQAGVRVLDTAAAYGTSEAVLGETLPPAHAFDVVTKTVPLNGRPLDRVGLDAVVAGFHRSLERLRASSVYALLVHHADDAIREGSDALWHTLERFKVEGLIEKMGVSVYSAAQLDALLHRPVELVQLPLNVLDQRLVQSGHLERLKEKGVEIHVRSAFLQGSLLMPTEKLPAHFAPVRAHLDAYHDALRAHSLSPVEGALGFLNSIREVDEVIVGVTSSREFAELSQAACRSNDLQPDYRQFAWPDPDILDPSRWPRSPSTP